MFVDVPVQLAYVKPQAPLQLCSASTVPLDKPSPIVSAEYVAHQLLEPPHELPDWPYYCGPLDRYCRLVV